LERHFSEGSVVDGIIWGGPDDGKPLFDSSGIIKK
jgi:hypothetical protein